MMYALSETIVAHNAQVNEELLILQNKSVRAVLDRMQRVSGAKNDNQLCEALQVNRSTLGSWVARDSVPYAICVDMADSRGVSLDWLLTGEGPMFRGEVESPSDGHVANKAPAPEPEVPELLIQLADSTRREQDRLTAIEKQLQELQAAVAALTRSP